MSVERCRVIKESVPLKKQSCAFPGLREMGVSPSLSLRASFLEADVARNWTSLSTVDVLRAAILDSRQTLIGNGFKGSDRVGRLTPGHRVFCLLIFVGSSKASFGVLDGEKCNTESERCFQKPRLLYPGDANENVVWSATGHSNVDGCAITARNGIIHPFDVSSEIELGQACSDFPCLLQVYYFELQGTHVDQCKH